ncbi:MAG: AAA family ATPase [bacterium]
MKAPFVVLEGLDGVGKSTLTSRLAERLGGAALDTPGMSSPLRAQVLDTLGLHQASRCLFYAATVVSVGARARHLADTGHPAVVDRYWLSTRAYARARGVAAPLGDVEAMVPAPDQTILLLLDEGERQRRLGRRGTTTADRETLNDGFRQVVLDDFRRPGVLAPTAELDLTGLDVEEAVTCLEATVRNSRAAG